MENPNTLQVSFFGGNSISYGEKTLDGNSLRSKKIWSLLAYLIAFRNKDISQNDLIELIYSEDKSSNPLNALKTLMHRVRTSLDELSYMGGKNLILQQSGSYKWNRSVPIDVDTDRFEALCERLSAPGLTETEIIELSQAAIDLYTGDFLPKFSTEAWVIPLHTYFRSKYINLVHNTVNLLMQRQEYQAVVSLCRKAITIDPYDELLYYNLMLALINLNQAQAALSQYESTTKLFYKEFGVTPSEDLQSLYRQIIKSSQSVEMDISAVKNRLREENGGEGSFFCEYEFFKDIYRLEVRTAARTGKPVHICLLSVVSPNQEALSVKAINSAMDKLITCVHNTLRKGDTFSRYSVSQLVIMLPLTTYESADSVLKRIVKSFRAAHPRSPAALDYSFQPIDAVM